MATGKPSPAKMAAELRRVLRDGGSTEHAAGVQWFFKDKIKSHGWYTGDLRRAAVTSRRALIKGFGLPFLLQVADQMFTGKNLEEKVFAVFLLEKLTDQLGDDEFRRFESWLPRISSWADHDGLVHYLIAPMVVAKPERVRKAFAWAKSRKRWHRRAACVALIQGTRKKMFFP
jgi:3-methyladenine DNA glycosylase AlkD